MATQAANGGVSTNGQIDKKAAREESLAKRLSDLEQDNRKQAVLLKQHSRQLELMKKEKDNLQQDYNKSVLAKTQLEKLCRELQRQNRYITEESLTKLKEEEEKRKETQATFQKQINDIMTMIKESKDSNDKLQDDKLKMSQHFKHLVEQTQAKQQEIEKIDKQMDLAVKLSEAKLTKTQMEAALEKEQMLKERHDMLVELKTCRQELNELQLKEKLLQEQLSMYTEKYQEFQTSFSKSNDIFVTYKKEMDKMSKKILTLEKESLTWKIKFEKSNVALLDMAAEKQMRDQILHKTTRQFIQLQKLCRTFQAERAVLIQALTDNNVEVPAMPEVPDQAPVLPELDPLPPQNDAKINALTKNCAELKKNLANLQSQLEDEVVVPAATDDSPKKSKNKNKKNKNGKKDDAVVVASNVEVPVVEEEKPVVKLENPVVDQPQITEEKKSEEPSVNKEIINGESEASSTPVEIDQSIVSPTTDDPSPPAEEAISSPAE